MSGTVAKSLSLLTTCSLILAVSNATCWSQSPYDTYKVDIQEYFGAVRIVVKTPDLKPAKRDIQLQVLARTTNYRSTQNMVSKELVIPAGQNSGSVEVAHGSDWGYGWYQTQIVLEDNDNGIYDSRDFLRHNSSTSGNWQTHLPFNLLVSSNVSAIPSRKLTANRRRAVNMSFTGLGVNDPNKLPNFIELLDVYESLNLISSGAVTSNLSFLQNSNCRFQCIHPADFFQDWKSLLGFQAIFVDKIDLQQIANSESALKTLKNWVSLGGQVVVFDCDKGFSDRDNVWRLVTGSPPRDRLWKSPSRSVKKLGGFAVVQSWQVDQSNHLFAVDELGSVFEEFDASGDTVADRAFIARDFLVGKIILVDDDLTAWKRQQWQPLFNCLTQSSALSTVGRSSSKQKFKPDFRIPGIGDPPVTAFQILIAGFVTLIGPGFYIVFSRTGRLYLLLFAIPAFSLFAVASLFLYAIISDGFATRGRVLSVSEIDHTANSGVHHARSVFYSGVSPNESILDSQTLVYDSRGEYSPPSRQRIRADKLSITGGEIRARSPFQLTTAGCFETNKQFAFSRSQDGAGGTITNAFLTPFELVIVRNKDQFYFTENVAGESTAACQAATIGDLNKIVPKIVANLHPDTPAQASSQYSSRWEYVQSWENESLSKWGRSDDLLYELKRGKLNNLIPANGYLAIAKTSEFVPNPQPQALFEDHQLHVVIGKW